MPKRYSLNEVKLFIDKNSNGKCVLLSNSYTNSYEKLKLQCSCGKIFYRSFNKLRSKRFLCEECSKKPAYNKTPKEKVIAAIEKGGCKYISGEYKNVQSKLLLQCSCGELFYKDMSHFLRGQNHCPKCGAEKSRLSKYKYTIEDFSRIVGKAGYTVLENNYVDCQTPIKCKCKNGHVCYIKLSLFLTNHSGCKKCANLNLKGENHWNYKGGESEVLDFFRKMLVPWKKEILKKYNYCCAITKSKKDIVIHHIVSFNTLVKTSCEELGLPLHHKIKDYSTTDFEKLQNRILEKHTLNIGIVLQRKVHNKFHSIYGKGNNTPEQFNEFLSKYYSNRNIYSEPINQF